LQEYIEYVERVINLFWPSC